MYSAEAVKLDIVIYIIYMYYVYKLYFCVKFRNIYPITCKVCMDKNHICIGRIVRDVLADLRTCMKHNTISNLSQ